MPLWIEEKNSGFNVVYNSEIKFLPFPQKPYFYLDKKIEELSGLAINVIEEKKVLLSNMKEVKLFKYEFQDKSSLYNAKGIIQSHGAQIIFSDSVTMLNLFDKYEEFGKYAQTDELKILFLKDDPAAIFWYVIANLFTGAPVVDPVNRPL